MRKVYFNKTVIELCTSIQEGLPLVATKYIREIVEGVLAAASTKFRVTLCAFVVMRNHLHILIVVHDPADVSAFMGYLKTELAHAVNSLLGRRKRSVWEPDFDSPVVLTWEKVMERLEYVYLNPARANLSGSIRSYPGVSSFEYAEADTGKRTFTKRVKKISRDAIPVLPKRVLSLRQQEVLASELRSGRGVEYELSVSPWAWLECFPETREADPTVYQKRFLDKFFEAERKVVAEHKFPAPSPDELRMQDPRQRYESKRDGRKMLCMSTCVDLRCAFIDWYRTQAKRAKEALKNFRQGDFTLKPPPGFFLPGGALLAAALFPAL